MKKILLFICLIITMLTASAKDRVVNNTTYNPNEITEVMDFVGLDSVSIMILYLQGSEVNTGLGRVVDACTVPNANNMYILYVKKGISNAYAKRLIYHELIHVMQYHLGRLNFTGKFKAEWDGIEVDLTVVPYNRLPWEIDVFHTERKIKKFLKQNK